VLWLVSCNSLGKEFHSLGYRECPKATWVKTVQRADNQRRSVDDVSVPSRRLQCNVSVLWVSREHLLGRWNGRIFSEMFYGIFVLPSLGTLFCWMSVHSILGTPEQFMPQPVHVHPGLSMQRLNLPTRAKLNLLVYNVTGLITSHQRLRNLPHTCSEVHITGFIGSLRSTWKSLNFGEKNSRPLKVFENRVGPWKVLEFECSIFRNFCILKFWRKHSCKICHFSTTWLYSSLAYLKKLSNVYYI